MANNIIIASTTGKNTQEIAASTTGIIRPDLDPLTSLGLWGAGLYYNNLLLINGHSAGIQVKVGKDTQLIASGDAYEWKAENMAYFNTIEILEVGGAAAIDINDLTYTASRIKRVY